MSALPGLRAIPLLGRTGGMARLFADPVGMVRRLREQGELVAIHPEPPLVAVFGAANVKAVLSDARRFHNIDTAPFRIPAGSSLQRLMRALTQMNGDEHRRQRRLMQPAFTRAALEGYAEPVVDEVGRLLDRWRDGQEVELVEAMRELTLRFAMRTLFGLALDDEEAGRLASCSMGLLSGLTDPRSILVPLDAPLLPYRKLLRTAERAEQALRELIARRRASTDRPADVLSRLIGAHDEDGTTLSDDDLVGQANLLLIAGHETTAFTLAWTLLLLGEHPEIGRSLAEEAQRVLGDAPPTVPQLEQLPLHDRVIRESMRLLPATPALFVRMARGGSFELGGVGLPDDTWLVISPLMEHRDPILYPDPTAFRPERWESLRPEPWEYLPFGAGPRICLGATFAAQALRLALPMLVRRFGFELAPQAVGLRQQGITMGPSAVRVRLRARPSDVAAVRVTGRLRELVA